MMNLNQVKSSSVRVSKFYAAHPISALAPVLISGASYKLLLFCIEKLAAKRYLLLESLSLFLICFPLAMLAEAVLAKLYLVVRDGGVPSLAGVRELLAEREIYPLTAKLVLLFMLWFFASLAIAVVVFFLSIPLKSVALGSLHPDFRIHPSHTAPHPFVWSWFGLYAFLLARYSFVVPLFVQRPCPSKSALRSGILQAKKELFWLGTLNLLGTELTFAIAYSVRQLWISNFVRGTLVLLGTAVIAAWFSLLRADLAWTVESRDGADHVV